MRFELMERSSHTDRSLNFIYFYFEILNSVVSIVKAVLPYTRSESLRSMSVKLYKTYFRTTDVRFILKERIYSDMTCPVVHEICIIDSMSILFLEVKLYCFLVLFFVKMVYRLFHT